MLSTMSWRGRLPAAQKPYTLTPKPPNSGLHDPKDRARRLLLARQRLHERASFRVKSARIKPTVSTFKALLSKPNPVVNPVTPAALIGLIE